MEHFKYEEIIFVFENCASAHIDKKGVLYFSVRGLTENLTANYFGAFSGKAAKEVLIHLRKDAVSKQAGECLVRQESLEYHLENLHDITNIIIVCEDKRIEFTVPFHPKGDDIYANKYEKVVRNGDEIVISIKKSRKDT